MKKYVLTKASDELFKKEATIYELPYLIDKYGKITVTDYGDVVEFLIEDNYIYETADSYYNK